MQIIKQSIEVLTDWETVIQQLKIVELAGRTCYKSEKNITSDSYKKFIARIVKSGHESVIEHCTVSVKIITNREVSHEIVRHRIASYSMESQRYVNYNNDHISFILPIWLYDVEKNDISYALWANACYQSEMSYKALIDQKRSPQEARTVLGNSAKTELIMTLNLRSWRNFINLRCSKAALPQIRSIGLSILREFSSNIPVIFDDLKEKYYNV